MPFEPEGLEKKATASPEKRLPVEETLESIIAKLAALGDPDDPWADPEVVAEHESLVAKKEEILRHTEEKRRADQIAQAALERAAAEQTVSDALQAETLAQQIKRGEVSLSPQVESQQEIPSDKEVARLFGDTIVYDSQGRAFTYHENVRFSDQAMLTMLGKNIENVAFVPKEMLKKQAFRTLLERQYKERYPYGNFETFYKLVSDPRFGFGESDPKWKEMSAEQIERSQVLAKEESKRLQDLNYSGDDGRGFRRMLEEGIRDMEAGREVL